MKSLNFYSNIIAIIALSFLFAACDFKKSDPITLLEKVNPASQGQGNGSEEPVEPVMPPEEQLITFGHLKRTALVTCKECHSKTSNPNKKPLLLTLDQFKARLDDVISETSSGDMPPEDEGYKALTDCEKAMLEKWIELGTPEKTTVKVYDLAACNPNPPTEPPVVEPPVVEPPVVEPPVVEPPVVEPPVTEEQLVTFDYLLKTSLISCAECHSKTKNPKKKPLLTNLEEFQARIVDVVTEIQNDDMPVTDEGAQLLNACEKAMLYKWVDAGAPVSTSIKVSDLAECKTNPPPPAPEVKILMNFSLNHLLTEPVETAQEPVLTFDLLLKTSFVSCSECHSQTKNPKKKPLLTNLEEFQARINDVKEAITADDMPETKKGAKLLNVCEKAMMNAWIDAGTPVATTIKISEIPECKLN